MSHHSLPLPSSTCYHWVSCLLLRLIQIRNTLWQVLSCSMFMRYLVWLDEHLLDHCFSTSFGDKMKYRPALVPWHLHLGIVLILKLVFSQPGGSCPTLSERGGNRRASRHLREQKSLWSVEKTHLLMGENTVTSCSCSICNEYHENKLFLWHSWLGHLVGKTGEWEGRKRNGKRTLSVQACACVYTRQVGGGSGKIKRV